MKNKTTLKSFLIKGFIPLAALSFFLFVINFFISIIFKIVNPLSNTISTFSGLEKPYSVTFTVCFIFIFTLFLGYIYSTKIGNLISNKTHRMINKIPGNKIYHIAYDVLKNLFGEDKKGIFQDVAFIKPYNKDNTAIEVCLITDQFLMDNDKYFSTFTPTGPNPTTGFIRIIHSDNVLTGEELDAKLPVDKAIRFIVSCGYNSQDLFSHLTKEQKNKVNNFCKSNKKE